MYINDTQMNGEIEKHQTKTVCKKIAKKIDDRHYTIAIEIGDLISNDYRNRDRECLGYGKHIFSEIITFYT